MSVPSYEARREAEAAMAARRELGPEYEAQIAAGLAERVEQAVWQQHQQGQQAATQLELARIRDEKLNRGQRFALTIISLGTGIPITAIAATQVDPGLLGVAVSWAGIVAVNLVFNRSNRSNRDRR
ncbi:hypothetical protein FOE78_20360 [Microlunatus elymi]|uniref:Uncharacterized protein n=1 Tax=Microlunatus elymi TaxID=2596828 RepID=A0A516Q3I2_9ACTN|nr:hypothetical protein [Microlunatus elymi]QDP97942.1 hypothetical protein FOE78_20360 [Microlunatus elymi]